MFPRNHAFALTVALVSASAWSDEPVGNDPAVSALVEEALQSRPELAQALAELRAAKERIPQVQALPDPMFQVGVQNDGFTSWQVGKMETSWLSFMASQTFPFPGKLDLRGDIAESDVRQRLLVTERLRLTTVADVRRGYLGVQLARERLVLLEKLKTVWDTSVAIAQSRYESGDGSQSDVLRARLELGRLQQRRRFLEVNERLQLQALNRLRHKPFDQRIDTRQRLGELDFPPPPDEAPALAKARAQSPELLAGQTGVLRAARSKELAGRSVFPDISVGAGVMVRGQLEPMWTVTVGVPVPVFAGSKQSRGVARQAP